MDGIYTLANDRVYDQLVALLNSIEQNLGHDYPVCVIAYDTQLEQVRRELKARKNVMLMDDPEILGRWEEFSFQVWQTHPTALDLWSAQGIEGVYRLNCNHRYAAFDPSAPFDRFVYLDADTLVLNSLGIVFDALNYHDFVTYDFQYKDPSHIFNTESEKLYRRFSQSRIEEEIFCSGFYASKRGLFPPEQRDWIVSQLADGDSELLYLNAPNQSVLNYMTMRTEIGVYNLARNLSDDRKTGNSVTSRHFEQKDSRLFDRGKPLTYLHYIGLSSKLFARVCTGENIDFPYRDLFLHYRFLDEPEKRPQLTTPSKWYTEDRDRSPSLGQRILRKLKR